MALTIEGVNELLEQATPGAWSLELTGYVWTICSAGRSPLTKPMYPKDAPLIAAAPDLARLAIALHAQLQQERVKSLMYQEALEAIVSGGDIAWQLDGENSYTLAMCRIANAALQALSAPQAQAGAAL